MQKATLWKIDLNEYIKLAVTNATKKRKKEKKKGHTLVTVPQHSRKCTRKASASRFLSYGCALCTGKRTILIHQDKVVKENVRHLASEY